MFMFECNKLFLLSPIQGFQLDFYVHESVNDAAKRDSPPRQLWSVSIKTRTFASINACNGSF